MTGICTMRLRLLQVQSLKEKRKVMRRILDRIRHRFNVSAAEVDSLDKWQEALIVVAHVSNEKKHVDGVLEKVTRLVEAECEIVERRVEIHY